MLKKLTNKEVNLETKEYCERTANICRLLGCVRQCGHDDDAMNDIYEWMLNY